MNLKNPLTGDSAISIDYSDNTTSPLVTQLISQLKSFIETSPYDTVMHTFGKRILYLVKLNTELIWK